MLIKRFLLLALAALSACSHTSRRPDQLAVEMRSLSRIPLDPQIQKTSDSIYHYLLGELAYQNEDFKGALKNFAAAAALADRPCPSLNGKLAELYVRDGDIEKARTAVEAALQQEPDNEHNLFLYAGVLETLGKLPEAAAVYQRLLKGDEPSLEAYLLLAGLYAKQQRWDDAAAILNRLTANPAYAALAWYQLGHIYESKRDYARAVDYYLRVYRRNGQSSNVVADILRVYLQDGQTDKARSFCRSVLERDPENLTARRVQAGLSADQQSFTAAVSHLQELRERSKDPNQSRFKIALMEIERQNFDAALRELNLILAAEPGNSEARFYLASVYAATGRSADAVAELKRIKLGDPVFVRARTFAAFVLMQSGDLVAAETVAREAWAADRNNRRVFYYLVSILRDQRKLEAAEELLAEEAAKDPQDAELWFQHGVILHDLQREDEAIAKMERVITMDPGYTDALNYIAYSLAESGKDLGRALALAKKALESKPEDAYYIDTLGWVYFQMGDYESAEKELGRAAKSSRKDAVIMEHYGDALQRRGKLQEAAAIYHAIVQHTVENTGRKGQDQEDRAAVERAKTKLEALRQSHPGLVPEDPAEAQPKPADPALFAP